MMNKMESLTIYNPIHYLTDIYLSICINFFLYYYISLSFCLIFSLYSIFENISSM